MEPVHVDAAVGEPAVAIMRVADNQWHALEDDQVVGRGTASPRPDGRIFLGIDAWHRSVFDQLCAALLAALPRPLYTVVDEADHELTSGWVRAGLTVRRREWEYLVPTDPDVTGLGSAVPPAGVSIVGVGRADRGRLRALDRAIRGEVAATIGWDQMPAEVLCRPDPATLLDPSKYAVATRSGDYVGLLRVVGVARQPRLGLVAVRAAQQRRGIATMLLAHVLGALHRGGTEAAFAEVSESNESATALFEAVGARRVGSNLELVLR
jgi:GNAT superfamily N-acetyltransferase